MSRQITTEHYVADVQPQILKDYITSVTNERVLIKVYICVLFLTRQTKLAWVNRYILSFKELLRIWVWDILHVHGVMHSNDWLVLVLLITPSKIIYEHTYLYLYNQISKD